MAAQGGVERFMGVGAMVVARVNAALTQQPQHQILA